MSDETTITFYKLPYAFKQRLVNLAPVDVLTSFQLTGHKAYRLSIRRGQVSYLPTLYITDKPDAFLWAQDQAKSFKFMKHVLSILSFISHYLDGPFNFYPYWFNALFDEELPTVTQRIYVAKTLLLNFADVKHYDKAVNLITGSYQQLVLHGNYNFDHVLKLMHKSVKQLQLDGYFRISHEQHDDFIKFVVKHTVDPEFSLALKSHIGVGNTLQKRLKNAFQNHPTHTFKNEFRTTFGIRKDPFWLHISNDGEKKVNLFHHYMCFTKPGAPDMLQYLFLIIFPIITFITIKQCLTTFIMWYISCVIAYECIRSVNTVSLRRTAP